MLKIEPVVLALTALSLIGCDDADSLPPPKDASVALPQDAGSPAVTLDSGRLDATAPSIDATTASRDGGDDAASDDQTVTLRFKGRLGSEELACDRNFAGIGSTHATVKVTDFRFFVSDVVLRSAAGVDVPVSLAEAGNFQTRDVALVDFTDAKGSCASAGTDVNTVLTGRVPRGSYTGIKFSTSVPETLNHADPALAPAPLKAQGLSWDWLQGYRFAVAELSYVSGGDAPDAGAPDGGSLSAADAATSGGGGHMSSGGSRGGVVHVGSTGCLGGAGVPIHCTKQNKNLVVLSGFDPTRNTIVADLAAVFANVDLTQETLCHGRGEECAPMFSALGIDLTTGAALPTQTVFRVE